MINCAEVDGARRELAYLVENGAKVALIKPAPVKGLHGWRSPALPEFDPFWHDVEVAGLPIALHASQPPLDEYVNKWEPPNTQSFMAMSAFRWLALGHREISDMLGSLICHGTLTRFPKLRIASVENGSSWIRPLFHDLEDLTKKMPQNFPEDPLEVFRRNVWVSPFWEGSVADVVDMVGWDKVMFGSDYPHPEAFPNPRGIGSTRKEWIAAGRGIHGRQRSPLHGPLYREPGSGCRRSADARHSKVVAHETQDLAHGPRKERAWTRTT